MFWLTLFVICSLVGGSIQLGPTTIRVYASCLLILYLITKRNYKHIHVDSKPIIVYLIFLFITLLAKLFSMTFFGTGVDETQVFFKRLLSLYLVGIVGYYGIAYIATTRTLLLQIFTILVIIGCVNAIASYLQYIGNPIGIRIALIFSSGEGDYMRAYLMLTESAQKAKFVVPGIFGHGAINGYMNSALGVLPIYYIFQRNSKLRLLGMISFLILVIGSYVTQERSGFGLLLLFSLYLFYKLTNGKIKYIFIFSLPFLLILFSENIIDFLYSNDFGRYSDFGEFEDRNKLIIDALSFIKNNWLFGGEEFYNSLGYVTPHNFFLHALIFSGILGLVAISLLFFKMLKDSYIVLKQVSNKKLISIYVASALSIYLLNGLFHSGSLITGDVLIWILYGSLLQSKRLECYKSNT